MTALAPTKPRSAADAFFEGAIASLPIIVGVAPFGALFGMLALEHTLSVADAMFMSAAIYAGASQLVGIDLFGANVAPWMIILSIFAVNFRLVLYSATVGRYFARWSLGKQVIAYFLLVDTLFAEAEQRTDRGIPLRFSWYMGIGLPIYISWLVATYLGAIFGQLIPDPHTIGIDFFLPIYFFCLVLSFRARAHWLPVVAVSAVASILAYRTIGSPWHVSVGALAGVVMGAFLPPVTDTKPTGEGIL